MLLQRELSGKTALVTAANCLIGRAVVVALEKQEMIVRKHSHSEGDLAVEADVRMLFQTCGPVDVMICCAGGVKNDQGMIPSPNDCMAVSANDFQAMLNRNLMTAVNCCRVFVPSMIERRYGKIVLIGSGIVDHPREQGEFGAYSVAKAALHEYSKILAMQLRPYNINVNCVAPTTVMDAPRTKTLDRCCTADEVAMAVVDLCQSGFVSGEVIRLSGGMP